MALASLEIRWRVGAEETTLRVGEDGLVHLDPAPDAPAPRRRTPRAAPPRRGQVWTREEEEAILARLNTVEDAEAIAKDLGRSRGAVLARAVVLGLITADEAGLRYPPVPAASG